jgi:hypothetical protein
MVLRRSVRTVDRWAGLGILTKHKHMGSTLYSLAECQRVAREGAGSVLAGRAA